MTETDFRFKHSRLLEYYQYIEMRLKGICACLLADDEKGWFERLDDYSSDPFGLLLQKVKSIQIQKNVRLLAKNDFKSLDNLREDRNYWVHWCFTDPAYPIIFKNGVMKRAPLKRIDEALNEAIEWDEKLTEIWKTAYLL